MIRLALISLALAGPAHAKWDYCYSGPPPEGVNEYTEMPPRTFGVMDYALWPHVMKRLCGLPHEAETQAVRRLVADELECSAGSDIAADVESALTVPTAMASGALFGQAIPPKGPEWDVVCAAAEKASVQSLRFGYEWRFDSETPEADQANLNALMDALGAMSEALNGGGQ